MTMEETKTDAGQGLGIAGFVLGILALILAFIPCIGILALIPGIIGITLSAIALTQANSGNGSKGLIIAALIISILATAVGTIWPLVIKKQIEHVVEDETGKTIEENLKDMGKDMEKVLEELEVDSINIVVHKKMTDAEFDKFLENYEKLINEAIALKKKAEAGDMKAIEAYSKISVQLASTLSKLASSDAKLSADQAKRLEKINKKYEKELDTIKQ